MAIGLCFRWFYFVNSNPSKGRSFFFSISSQTGNGDQPVSSEIGARFKWPRCGDDHPPPPNTKIKHGYTG
jgi:hypothetical protein